MANNALRPLRSLIAGRRHGRRTAAVAGALAAAVLTAGLVSGCGSASNSVACFPNMGTIAENLIAIHEAGLDASNDPARTGESISIIDENLAKMSDTTSDVQFNNAVDNLNTAIANYNKAVLDGDPHPDTSAITSATNELASICTP